LDKKAQPKTFEKRALRKCQTSLLEGSDGVMSVFKLDLGRHLAKLGMGIRIGGIGLVRVQFARDDPGLVGMILSYEPEAQYGQQASSYQTKDTRTILDSPARRNSRQTEWCKVSAARSAGTSTGTGHMVQSSTRT
jgi:hypothetical protein